MPNPERTDRPGLRLVLSSAVLAISAPAAVIFALRDLPQALVLALALLAALALIDVAGIYSAAASTSSRPPVRREQGDEAGSTR